MAIDSLGFVVFVFAVLFLYVLCRTTKQRQLVFVLSSFAFLGTFFIDSIVSALYLLVVLVSSFLAIKYLETNKNKIVYRMVIAVLVVAFPAMIYSSPILEFLGIAGIIISVIGYAYIMLRLIHVITDVYEGSIKSIELLPFLAYNLSFLTLIAGPIQRYKPFLEQWESLGETQIENDALYAILNRIVSGYLYLVVFVPLLELHTQVIRRATFLGAEIVAALSQIASFYMFPVTLYLNFAGYCSVVIGIGILFGFQLPENFNKPWLAKDLLEFWERWHITLSIWLRDYLFTPIFRANVGRFKGRLPTLILLTYFFTFLIGGIWHRPSVAFVKWGLVLGTGTAISKYVLDKQVARLGRENYLNMTQTNKLYKYGSRVAVFHVIAFSLYFIQ